MKQIRMVSLFLVVLLFALESFASKKVLVLYSTGGHSTAARSVEDMLKQYPEEFEVIRHDFAEELTGFPRWFYFGGYDLISQKANVINKLGVFYKWLQAERKPLYASERFNATFNQPENILAYIEKVQPDVIISTHFSLADTLAMLREQGHLKDIPVAWTHLDMVDNTFFRQIGDQLDMSFLPTKDMKARWGEVIPSEKLAAVGIPIMSSLLQTKAGSSYTAKDVLESHRESLGLSPSKPTVFLIGGSMGALSYDKIINEISGSFASNGQEHVQLVAVCGRNERVADALKTWSISSSFPKNVELHIYGFIDQNQLRQLQNASDLIISKPGGLTTFELLASEKPVIMTEGIGIQEQFNAEYVSKEKAALYFPKTNGIGKAVYSLLRIDHTLRETLLKNQKALTMNFDLQKIVKWTRHAQVTQPFRPVTPVLTRQRELKQSSKAGLILNCSKVFKK